jgi:hypothetical protein
VAAVLPAVVLLGEFTFVALLRNTLENLVLLRQMQGIRGCYRILVPEADQFFGQAAEDKRFSAAMATMGLRSRPAGMLFTGASVIAAVNSIVGGVGAALLAEGRSPGGQRCAAGRHRHRRGPVRAAPGVSAAASDGPRPAPTGCLSIVLTWMTVECLTRHAACRDRA